MNKFWLVLLVFWLIIIFFPEIIAYLIGWFFVFIWLNMLVFFWWKKTWGDWSYVQFWNYKIYKK